MTSEVCRKITCNKCSSMSTRTQISNIGMLPFVFFIASSFQRVVLRWSCLRGQRGCGLHQQSWSGIYAAALQEIGHQYMPTARATSVSHAKMAPWNTTSQGSR